MVDIDGQSVIDSSVEPDRVATSGVRLRGELLLAFLFLLAVVGLLRIGTYQTPPTWDAAMTVWPAAIEMSELGPRAVLAKPTYEAGGPNTHTLSLVTLVTAATISAVGAEAAIVLGHIANTVTLAFIGLVVFALLRSNYSRAEASLVALASITFPVMVGQSAYLYTELLASLFVLLAIAAATRRRVLLGGVMAAAGIAVKPLAAIVIPVIWLLARRQGHGRAQSVGAAGVGLLSLIPSVLVPAGSLGGQTILERIEKSVFASALFLRYAPELVVIPVVALGLWLIARRRGDQSLWPLATVVLIGFFFLFFFTNGVVTAGYFALPRYFALLVPVVFVSAAVVMSDQKRFLMVVMGILVVFSLSTLRGPYALGNNTSVQPIAERSLAFVDLFRMHSAGLELLAEISRSMPVYYDHYAHFGAEYPEMNHFTGTIKNGVSTSLHDVWDGSLESLPSRFGLILEFPWLGGHVLHDIYNAAVDDPNYAVETIQIEGRVDGAVRVVTVTRLNQ